MRISVAVWIVCVLVAVGMFAWMGAGIIPKPRPDVAQGEALVGGPFELRDGNGAPVTEKDFAGKYMLVYFGFTHCPDICPTGLILIENALDQLGDRAEMIVPIFVSLDPERDTPEVMAKYVANFGERIVGLTGTAEQIKQIADGYKVYYRKVEAEDSLGGYMIDHSGYMYLMGPDGKYRTHFPHHISESALKDGLAKFVH
jgi:protein SCO1/2